MKIAPINLAKTTSFQGNTKAANTQEKKPKFDTWDKQMFAVTCCLTAFPGVEFAKKGFKRATTMGKLGKIEGGTGIALGLATILMPLWKFLKKINSDN